ncbi:competence/damage-inducible protein A [Postechiella marina]|uniref:CinA-like protein n=1 Tax=Postechiella marina TaxID=943941 RepID=A0ABP8CHV4_9FLAO
MLAEIITIGDELLIGQVVDTNSAFIAKELNKIGVSVYQITSIQDDKEHILQAFKEAESRVDIILITGGLGPTKDDITKKTIAEYFNDTLVRNPDVLKNIETLWKRYVRQTLLQVNKDQAFVPSKAKVLMNTLGTAPGMWLEKNDKTFIALPGVPFEMRNLITTEVVPKLKDKYDAPFILHRTLLIYGLGESTLADRIQDWEDNLPKHIKLAYLPSIGKMRLRLSSKGFNAKQIIDDVQKQIDAVLPLVVNEFVGFEEDEKSLEAFIGEKLTEQEQTLAVVESCTGGKLAGRFTANSGASAYFKGGMVSYATQTKIDVLGVSKSIIDKYSVVSAQVAEAMAQQARQLFKTDYAVATTGNAGPTKGDADAEVGTVFVAIASKSGVFSEKFIFPQPRERVVNKAISMALEMLQKEILKN